MNFKFRWLIPLWFLLILPLIAFDLMEDHKIVLSFIVGAIGGFLLDVLGHTLGLWNYPRQPFLSRDYFMLVIPAWGVFGSQINVSWNLLREYLITFPDWTLSIVFTSILLAVLLFCVYEIPNLYRKSWEYSVSLEIVAIGWIPLILYFRILYKIFLII